MVAQLVDLDQEFNSGNMFTLEVAENLANLLSDEFRVIVKYDRPKPLPSYNDNKLNVVIATSRETHDVPNEFFRDDVFAIFQHYFMLDKWGDPLYNPLVYPMPLGPFKDSKDKIIKPLLERKYDFSFVGQIPDTGARDCFKRHLDRIVDEGGDKFSYFVKYTDGFGCGLDTEEYLDILSESRVALCPQGSHSYETFRFFESILMGAFPLVEQLPRLWHYETAPHFKTPWRDLDSAISKILNFIQDTKSRKFLYQVADYCRATLIPENLAAHLYEKLNTRRENIELHRKPLDEFRKKLNELDTF